jgi:hypothetical protein
MLDNGTDPEEKKDLPGMMLDKSVLMEKCHPFCL